MGVPAAQEGALSSPPAGLTFGRRSRRDRRAPTSLSERDLVTVLAYLDGELSEEETMAFEVRLSDEPDLARSVETFDAVDRLERWAWTTRPRRPLGRWIGAVAAVGIVAGLWYALRGHTG